jgi:hypothetical protein
MIQDGRSFLQGPGDPKAAVTAVRSLVEDGDLDLKNQLGGVAAFAEDQVALGARGEWYPVHDNLMHFAAAPFYFLFGQKGCLIFNFAAALLLSFFIYRILLRLIEPPYAFVAALLSGINPVLMASVNSFTYDVFGALVLIASYWLITTGQIRAAGFCWGLTFFARLPNVISAPGFALFLLIESFTKNKQFPAHKKRLISNLWSFSLGAGLPCLFFLLANRYMFGSFFETSYDHWVKDLTKEVQTSSQRQMFNAEQLKNLPRVLFDPKEGIVLQAALLMFLSCCGALSLWKKSTAHFALIYAMLAMFLLLYSVYEGTVFEPSRHFIPVFSLLAVPCAFALKRWGDDGEKT